MSTPCLIDVQRWVRDYLLTQKSEIEKNAVKLNPQGTSTGVDRLAVYAQGYVARIEEALREAYPAVEVVIGHEKFHVLAREYGIRVKSHSYNLSSVGNRLPQHLYKHDLLSQYPYLRDLARLEWALTESFHARSEPSVDAAVLARITPERWPILKFQFKSHVKLVDVTHPVLEVWLQAKQKKTINEAW